MSVYFLDREGKQAPVGSTFEWVTFEGERETGTVGTEIISKNKTGKLKAVKKTFLATKRPWIYQAKHVLETIEKGYIEKLVLARQCVLEFEHKLDPMEILCKLRDISPGLYVYGIFKENSAFIGASPERLLWKNEREIVGEALAGTQKKGETKEDAKNTQEFSVVQKYLHERLSPFCVQPVTFGPVTQYPAHHLQHLHSPCRGTLKEDLSHEHLINAIHPTPALCGYPQKEVYKMIKNLELFDRGMYGGVIGWHRGNVSDWAVAIRCCRIEENKAILYSGAGIVQGSDPEKEWDELDLKLQVYDSIFDY